MKLFHGSNYFTCELIQQVFPKSYNDFAIYLSFWCILCVCVFEMIMVMLLLTVEWRLCCIIWNYSIFSLCQNIQFLYCSMHVSSAWLHVFWGTQMAVLALLRHWHKYPWGSKKKLKYWNEPWGWKVLSRSFICWSFVRVWCKGDLMKTAGYRVYMNLDIHIQWNIYILLVRAQCWIRG